jgi:membrane protease YdiL (CAAX protease family)
MNQHPADSDGPTDPPDSPSPTDRLDALYGQMPDPAPDPATRAGPPGASTFTIEGRAAPALFVIGWLASLLGLSTAVAGLLGGSIILVGIGAGLLSLGLIAASGNQAFERRAHGARYAGPSPFLVFGTIVATTVFVLFVVGLFLDLALGGAGVFPPLAQLMTALLGAVASVGVIRLTVVGTGALSWAEMQVRPFSRRALDDLAIGAALAAPVIVVTFLVISVLFAIFGVTQEGPLPPSGSTGGLLIQLVAGALIVPIYEELMFRGLAISAWERTIGPDRAVIRATLLFALAHVLTIEVPRDATAFQVLGLVVMGAGTRLPVAYVLGLLFVRRRSIWAPIGLHATFNGVLLILGNLGTLSGGG